MTSSPLHGRRSIVVGSSSSDHRRRIIVVGTIAVGTTASSNFLATVAASPREPIRRRKTRDNSSDGPRTSTNTRITAEGEMQSIRQSVGQNGVNMNDDVRTVQRLINANLGRLIPLRPLEEDGRIGPLTIGAITEFQSRVVRMQNPDGRVDPNGRTLRELNSGVTPTAPPPNLTAVFEDVARAGQLRQMMSGRITVNNNTYDFRSGGHGRGNLPTGTYTVTPHLWDRDENGFSVDGVGFSFAVSDAFDSRVGDTRTLLRIHPDGGPVGTNGCIGIVGNGDVQRAFREDMRAEFGRSNDSVQLTVR